ncbi:MAG TPA: T9SS type A sorting domain-containing protein, partial [Saprospiraceae bacterium]
EARDYTPQQVAMDSAVALGLADMPIYFSVFGWSPDGNIANIDYEVKELDPSDNRIFFGNQIVPVVRIVINEDIIIDGITSLPSDQIISVFPNPATDDISVLMEFTNNVQDVHISLINNTGQVVHSKSISSTVLNQIESFDVSTFTSGSYHMRVQTSEGERSIPVVILY